MRLRREFFESILTGAVASTFDSSAYATHEEWKAALAASDVRLQWYPDHDPRGHAHARRAIQLGLRGPVPGAYGRAELLEVIDMTGFVTAQRKCLAEGGNGGLDMPVERVYRPVDNALARRLGLD